jgi:hypothetical protein
MSSLPFTRPDPVDLWWVVRLRGGLWFVVCSSWAPHDLFIEGHYHILYGPAPYADAVEYLNDVTCEEE